jgi:hypothetical protein
MAGYLDGWKRSPEDAYDVTKCPLHRHTVRNEG